MATKLEDKIVVQKVLDYYLKKINEACKTNYIKKVKQMPIASDKTVGIVQYQGETNSDYIKGCFYECYYDTTTNTYKWNKLIDTDANIQVKILPTPDINNLNKIYQYIGETNAKYKKAHFYVCTFENDEYLWKQCDVDDENLSELQDVDLVDLENEQVLSYDDISKKWKNVTINNVYAKLDNVITKDSTIVYTPTGDYHPVNKKYVDDKLSELGNMKIRGRVDTFSDLPLDAHEGDVYFIGLEGDISFKTYVKLQDGNWLQIGETNVDLSDYYKKSEVDGLLGKNIQIIDILPIPTIDYINLAYLQLSDKKIYLCINDGGEYKWETLTSDNIPISEKQGNILVNDEGLYVPLITIQKDELPLPSFDELNNVYQYVGETIKNSYVNGYFYKCVVENSNYIWKNIKVQPDEQLSEYVLRSELENHAKSNLHLTSAQRNKIENSLDKSLFKTSQIKDDKEYFEKVHNHLNLVTLNGISSNSDDKLLFNGKLVTSDVELSKSSGQIIENKSDGLYATVDLSLYAKKNEVINKTNNITEQTLSNTIDNSHLHTNLHDVLNQLGYIEEENNKYLTFYGKKVDKNGSGGQGDVTWNNVLNKPFSTLDANTLKVIDGVLSVISGGSSGASNWSELTNKPFDSLGNIDFSVVSNVLNLNHVQLATKYASKNKEHEHENLDKLEFISENENEQLLYRGKLVSSNVEISKRLGNIIQILDDGIFSENSVESINDIKPTSGTKNIYITLDHIEDGTSRKIYEMEKSTLDLDTLWNGV